MRRTLLALTGLVLVSAASVDASPRAPVKPAPVTATTFLVSGRGWGHGVGMSQYGALGFANEGRTHEDILAHYYPGTELGPAPVARVRVLLAEGKRRLTVSSPVPFRARDVFGTTLELPSGRIELGPKLEITVNGAPTELAGPVVLVPGRAPLEVGGNPYRGQLEIASAGGKLSAIDVVGLEDYLAGVVPREMPAAWPDEALRAQAVAARSYALAHRLGGKGFDLYADVRSQVYGGVRAEDARTSAAVQATAGRVLLYDGKIVDALFHSTSGGRTVSAEEAFGKPVPYLVVVDDPYSSLSPVHRWGPTPVPDAAVRKGLELTGPVLELALTRGASGRVRTATVTTAAGATTVAGSAFRSGLGLRSTWITRLGSLSLTRPGGPALYGSAVVLRGSAKGVGGAVLWRRVDGAWKHVLARPQGGVFAYRAKLLEPGVFRLAAGEIGAAVLKVPVAPRVRVARAPGALQGTVRPAQVGAAVEVQRLEGEEWLPAAESIVDEVGAYRAELELEPGSYRVRVAAAGGFAEGLSPTVQVGA